MPVEHPSQAGKEVRAVQMFFVLHKLGLPMVVPGGDAEQACVCVQKPTGGLKVREEVGRQLHVILHRIDPAIL